MPWCAASRTRRYLVEDVQKPREKGADTVVSLACMEDYAIGHRLTVFLGSEIDFEVLAESSWETVTQRGFDQPRLRSGSVDTHRCAGRANRCPRRDLRFSRCGDGLPGADSPVPSSGPDAYRSQGPAAGRRLQSLQGPSIWPPAARDGQQASACSVTAPPPVG